MAQTVLITLTTAGANTGPFDLYSDVDSYITPFENDVPKASLVSGYTSTVVPDLATIIRVQSDSECTNYIDLTIVQTTTTTTSTEPPPPPTCSVYEISNNGGTSISWSGNDCLTNAPENGTVNPGQTVFTGCILDSTFLYGNNGFVTVTPTPC